MIIKKLKQKLNKIKICAVFTTICFMVSTLGVNLYATPIAENITKKYEDVFNKTSCVSNQYGKITSYTDVKSDITVINIQDLHCHPQTQRNISNIIGEIADKYNLTKIYVEGGYGDIDTSWLNRIKDNNIRKQAIEKLLQEGILTGSEYFKLTSNNKVELKGIDEEKIHKDNVKRLSWIISQQDKYKEILEKVNDEIKILENRYVNNRNKRFNYDIEKYLSNKIDSKKFYKQLIKYVKDINNNPDKYNNITAIKLEEYPNIINFITLRQISKNINIKNVTQQLQVVINELKNRLPYDVYTKLLKETENLSNGQKVIELITLFCKKEGMNLTKYHDLNCFLESNYITKKINPIDLILEERQLITEIRKALSYNNEEYEITFVLDFYKYFKDYLEYKLTDADWKYFETGYETFRQLYSKYASVDRIKEIEQDFDNINKYYTINDKRNNIFVKKLLQNENINLLNSRKERSEEDILKESKEIIIAVTGGFHSSELEQILVSNDVNTIVITPKIYENIKQANEKYIELIEIQSKVRSQALSYIIASCTTDIEKQKLLLSIVKDILGSDVEKLKEVLGKDIDLSLLEETTTIDTKTKSELRNIIETTVEQVLKVIPQEGMRNIILPDIDEMMLDLAQELVKNGIYFSKGMIFELEKLNGKDIKGIPAEIYSRMLPALQKALFEVSTKEEQPIFEDEVDQDIQDLYEDTGATESINIYLEDINKNPELFIELLKDSVINKKLIVLHVFRNPIDIDKLDREQQKKLYNDIRDMFFKIYTDKPLYDFISQPENKDFMQYDIHFFLLEILENSFMHGNKGFDKPIYIYMNLNEQNEINNLRIYNKISQEDDNFQMRFIRMRLALLGGQHKSNVLMKQNPYRTFEIDDNFKGKFYKVASDIKPLYDDNAAQQLRDNSNSINYFSIFMPLQSKNRLFKLLSKIPHIWEEIIFRVIPISLSIVTMSVPAISFLTIPLSLIFFTICQNQFIKAHNISQWISQTNQEWTTSQIIKAIFFNAFPSRELKEDFKQFENTGKVKESLRQRYLPTIILSLPYLYSLLFAPTVPILALSTIIGIVLHKYFNLILKSKLNIFTEETTEESITVSDFLANKRFIDLNSIQEQQVLAEFLDNRELSKQDITDIVNKIDLDDISQSNNLLETFYKQRTINQDNKKMLISALAQKADVNNATHLSFLKNILLSDRYSLSVDETVASVLAEKFDFYNERHIDFLIDYFRAKQYYRKFQITSLNNEIINKIDINNSNQIKLLGLFSFIDDKTLYSLLSKFDFSNKNTLQSLFKIILQLNLPQRQEIFSFILNKLDLKNNIDFKVLQNIISNADYINGTVINNILAHLDFNDTKHLKFIKDIINNKKNIEITVIESFKEHMDINNPIHVSLFKDLIEGFFFANTIDSKVVFFERIREILQKINIEQLNDTEKYAFKIFTDILILNIQKILNSIQNENIKTKDDKITVFLGFLDNLFDELIELTNVLSEKEQVLSEQALNNLKDAKEQISFIQDMINEKITMKDFAEKFGFRFSQQTPNTYIDSNRYSFTKILSLFPEKVLKRTVKKHSPTYIIEKEEFDPENLKSLLIKFNAYMKLLDENEYVINKFGDVSSFDSQFEDVVKHIQSMIDCLSVFNTGDAGIYRRVLGDLLEKINNNQTTIEEQKKFSKAGKFQKIGTISNLINQIHQTANLDFVLNIRESARFSLRTAQNIFVAKDDRTIATYNLSQKQVDPEIKRLLLMLIENPDFTTTDRNSQIFIKDNIFLWNGLLGDHSGRVLIDFSRDSRNIFIDFSEGERSEESRSRILALQKILSNFGFTVELYNNNNSLTATINKDTDITNSTDICDMAQKAMIALSNAASLYRTNIPKQVIDTATLGVMDIYKKCFFVSAIENNIIKTKVNNLSFFNRILSYLQLPKIPFTEQGMISYIKAGPFFKRQIKTLGQNTINKYINQPIEQAFATGYLKVNENGVLERNKEYNPVLSVVNKLNMFFDKEIGDSHEVEMLNQGAILSQIPEQDLNLKTCGQIGRYILKTGYIKLSDGSLNDNIKGEFLSVRMLVDNNGIVRYSESELVGLPEFMQNETGRMELTSEQLQYILSKQGYDISTPEKLTDTEIMNYRTKLQEDISSSNMPIAYGILISTSEETDNVVGIMGKTGDIFTDKFASPENVDISAKSKISLFAGGSYSSHAGIVLREYHKTAMIVNDSQITKDGKMKITFYQSKDNVTKIGEFNTQEIEETEITLQDKDIVIIDLTANKLILFQNSVFKNILFDLQRYIENKDIEKIKDFIEKNKNNKLIDKIIEYIYYQSADNEWLQGIISDYLEYDIKEFASSEKHSRVIKKNKLTIKKYLPHNTNTNVYRFGEKESLNKTKVGTKSANQSKLYLAIEQLKYETGITNVAVPNGIAIDYTILENLLGIEYTNLYNKLLSVIQSDKDEEIKQEEIQSLLFQIRELINNLSNSRIKEYIGKKNLRSFKNKKVIVRSSGVGEDSLEYSAAGIAESFGNIEYENISNAVRSSLNSFFSQRAIDYMLKTGKVIKPAVLIEEFIEADKAGIMMSEDSDGNRIIQVINGQGEDIVSGRITPYSFTIDINSGEKIDGNYTNEKTITKETLEQLTKIMQWLEETEGYPVDIEFLIKDNIIYIVQVRPITTLDIDYEYKEEPEEFVEPISETIQDSLEDEYNRQNLSYDKSKKKKSVKVKKKKNKKESKSKRKKITGFSTSIYTNNNDIRQPQGFTTDDVINSFTKLATSKDSFDKSLELNQQQIKDVLLRLGLTQRQIDKIDFNEGLPDYVISLLKNKNSQITETTIDPRKSLIENLKEHPMLFSLAIETLIRVYASNFDSSSTLGDLLSFIEQRYAKRLYEATCTDLRGYFGEIYLINTLIAGLIPDKRAGPIIIRPELPDDNNGRGFDIYDINRVKIQVKTGGSEIVHHHFSRYWFQPTNTTEGIITIPVITTKNVKENSFERDNRVQGMDVTTETVTKFSHDFISALHGIAYKRNNPAIRNIKLKDLIDNFKGFSTENPMTVDELLELLNKNKATTDKKAKKQSKKEDMQIIDFDSRKINVDAVANQDIIVTINSEQIHILSVNDEQILLNEEQKRELSKDEYALYGIEKVEYDEFGNITYITFKEGVSLSNLTIDGKAEGSKENNIPFAEQEIKGLNTATQTQGYIDVYLDGDIDEICHLIKKAAKENKLIVFHLFEKGFKTSRLTPSQMLDVYKNAMSLISNRFQLSDIFSHSFDDSKYTEYGVDFFFEEILKNALIRGNFGQFEEPVALYIKLDENKNLIGFSVYNKSNEGEIYKHKEVLARASHFMLTGDSRSTDIMLNNPVRNYSLEKKQINGTEFKKADVSLKDAIDMELYQLEKDYKNSEENVSISDIKTVAMENDTLTDNTTTDLNSETDDNFTNEEIQTLNKDTATEGFIDIYMDDDTTEIKKKIFTATTNNKLIVLHLFREVPSSEKEKSQETFFKISRNLAKCFSNDYGLNSIFPAMADKEVDFQGYRYGYNFFLQEIIKNAIVHGYDGQFDKPIALSMKINDNNEVQNISVYTKNIKHTAQAQETIEETKNAGLNGYGLGSKYMSMSYLRSYEENPKFGEGKFFKVTSDLYDNIDETKKIEFEQFLEIMSLAHRRGLAILPENMEIVNKILRSKFGSSIIVATIMAFKEFKASMKPNFVDLHQSEAGKQGASRLREFITRYDIVETDSMATKVLKGILGIIFKGASVVKHIVIDYRYIKSSGIREAINMFGDETYMDENGNVHIPPVMIVDNLSELQEEYELRNTGIKVDGKSIYQIGEKGMLIYGAESVSGTEVTKALNDSMAIREAIEEKIRAKGYDGIKVEIEGVIQEEGEGVRFEDGITIIGNQELQNKSVGYVEGFVSSSLEIKRSMGVMYSQKALISLESIDDMLKLEQGLKQGRARKIISKSQYEQLKLSAEDIIMMRESGIEIYIDDNEIEESIKESGISGQIVRKDGKVYIQDYYSQEETEVEEIGEEESLTNIENKLVNSQKPIMIDIKVLAKKFQRENILGVYKGLNTLIGNIKIRTGIGQLTETDIKSLGYNLDYNKIPELTITKPLQQYSKQEIEDMLNVSIDKIETNREIKIILKSIDNKERLKGIFSQIIKERILAKTALSQNYKEYGLKDKKLEILLGEMLFKQLDFTLEEKDIEKEGNLDLSYIDKNGEIKEVRGEKEGFMEKINQDMKKIQEMEQVNKETRVAINSIIEIILVYGDSYKNKQMARELDKNDARNYRAMMAAA